MRSPTPLLLCLIAGLSCAPKDDLEGDRGGPASAASGAPLVLRPPALDFAADVGTTAEEDIAIWNMSPRPVLVQRLALDGEGAPAFEVRPVPLPRLLYPGQSMTASIGFHPYAEGPAPATLRIENDTAAPAEAPLRGTATASPRPPPGDGPPPGDEPPPGDGGDDLLPPPPLGTDLEGD